MCLELFMRSVAKLSAFGRLAEQQALPAQIAAGRMERGQYLHDGVMPQDSEAFWFEPIEAHQEDHGQKERR